MLTLVLADTEMRTGLGEIYDKKAHPEIVHITLLLTNDSGIAEEREVKTIVHTRDNKLFYFDPDVEIPEDKDDFMQMIKRTVQGDPPQGIQFTELPLMNALKEEIGHKIVMSPDGDRLNPVEEFSRAEDYIVVIGGFKEGDYISPVYEWADQVISISDNLVKTWTVATEALVAYRYCSLE